MMCGSTTARRNSSTAAVVKMVHCGKLGWTMPPCKCTKTATMALIWTWSRRWPSSPKTLRDSMRIAKIPSSFEPSSVSGCTVLLKNSSPAMAVSCGGRSSR
uniref:(northern house mosquito) hypothetical protein n=1 Tax=Culex pipiens TaxID=7175 RepID=A0A8D8BLK0_CULPI